MRMGWNDWRVIIVGLECNRTWVRIRVKAKINVTDSVGIRNKITKEMCHNRGHSSYFLIREALKRWLTLSY